MASCDNTTECNDSQPAVRRRLSSSRFIMFLVLCSTANSAMAWLAAPVLPMRTFNNENRLSTQSQSMRTATARAASVDDELGVLPQVQVMASSGLDSDELSLLMAVISQECQHRNIEVFNGEDDSIVSLLAVSDDVEAIGTLGRVLLVRASKMEQELLEDLEFGICEQVDELLMEEVDDDDDELISLKDSVLIHFQTDNDDDLPQVEGSDDTDYYKTYLSAIVQKHVMEYEMVLPVLQEEVFPKEESAFVPSIHVELDGGYVSYPLDEPPIWDTSSLLVFDNLLDNSLRKRLLDVMIGKDSDDHDPQDGPDPARWVRGSLLDVPNAKESDDGKDGGGWGLTDEGLEQICFEQHDAVSEMESILADLFPDFWVCRLPETVLGVSVTPMTANAPTAGDVFGYHIDADPNAVPSSPWMDVFGRYPNRAPGKPRFMSCLVYLNEEWDSDEWGAPTRFVDVPTDETLTVYDVQARPGRCIIMDQDIGHSVVAPTAAAGKRPRYSMVWKLILHPKVTWQDMKHLSGERTALWPETEYFGSAARSRET